MLNHEPTKGNDIPHAYIAKINERHLLRVIREQGPRSRADLVRETGLSAPTVSKAAASLLNARLLRGDQGKRAGPRQAGSEAPPGHDSVQVLGMVIDVGRCSVVASGLDGELRKSGPDASKRRSLRRTDRRPGQARAELDGTSDVRTLAVGVTVPGLIDHRRNLDVLSPNCTSSTGVPRAATLVSDSGSNAS